MGQAGCRNLLAQDALDVAKAREGIVKGMLTDQPLPLRTGA
jgi:hypothetical protein